MTTNPSIRELEIHLQDITEPLTERERQAVRIARALLSHVRNIGTPAAEAAPERQRHQTLNPRSTVPTRRFVINHTSGGARPEGAVTVRELAVRTGYGVDHVRAMVYRGEFPKAAIQGGATGPSYWTKEQAEQIVAIAKERQTHYTMPGKGKRGRT